MRHQAAGMALATLLMAICVDPAAVAGGSKPAPPTRAEALRACPDGGFAVPGSTTCVRLSGALETEGDWSRGSRAATVPARSSLFSMRARGRFAADVRVPTELGPLRVYTSVRGTSSREPDVLHR